MGFVRPTIFLSPNLPGLVYANPAVHVDILREQQGRSDATTMRHSVVKRHAEAHPECVIEATIPKNPCVAAEDPLVGMARDIAASGRFPMLARLFHDVAPRLATCNPDGMHWSWEVHELVGDAVARVFPQRLPES